MGARSTCLLSTSILTKRSCFQNFQIEVGSSFFFSIVILFHFAGCLWICEIHLPSRRWSSCSPMRALVFCWLCCGSSMLQAIKSALTHGIWEQDDWFRPTDPQVLYWTSWMIGIESKWPKNFWSQVPNFFRLKSAEIWEYLQQYPWWLKPFTSW